MGKSLLLTRLTAGLMFIIVLFGVHLFTLRIVENVHEDKITEKNVVTIEELKILLDNDSATTTIAEKSKILQVKEILLRLSEDIRFAKIHVRGTKTRTSLIKALSRVTKLLLMTNTTTKGLIRQSSSSKHVCKEVFMGGGYGSPLYYNGFEPTNCSHASPIEKLVTIVVLHRYDHTSSLTSLLRGIQKYNNRIKVIVGIKSSTTVSGLSLFNNTVFKVVSSDISYGKAWNALVEQVTTEYTLITRNITYFNMDARIGRLVHEIESLNVVVAGGASRDEDGYWKLGCYQSVFKNYSLVYEEGYDESLHECIFCDYIDGPFIIRTKTMTKYKLDEKLTSSSVFHDFFLRLSELGEESVVCPDSMYYINRPKPSNDPTIWVDLAKKYDLYRFKFANAFDIVFSCSKWKGDCKKVVKGYALHPCCIQELTNVVKFFMGLCEDSGIICELHCGTLLGAVKFGKTLPWEWDADIRFLTSNFTALLNQKQRIRKQFRFSDDKGRSLKCCEHNRTKGGIAFIKSAHWTIELYGYPFVDSEMLITDGIEPTKVLVDGQWVWGPRNPGLHARNAYGYEIYAHAEHWRVLGMDPRENYQPGTFASCKTPGRLDCLDNFNADGDIQFRTLIP